ncbi:hypothetical protein B5F77_13160 [Parabacteroides sp. An277]|uniref:hypothetical protein n=1 Tax=Parabacteroides sp. An277 TaxID=1965619 RepID=UPI000B370BB6|nr:hypothetical protein [Parabacteroides sp. An277]OUO50294.1 hypothetical protein B5F77_13160 [Parabacteroides sp. An277]
MIKVLEYIIIGISVFMLHGCGSEADLIGLGTVNDLSINAYLRDSAGNDLLDPTQNEYINPDSIRAFYVKEGQVDLNSPTWLTEREDNGLKYIDVYFGLHHENGYSTLVVYWTNTWVDTICCQLNEYDDIITDVYVDGKSIWSISEGARDIVFTRPSVSDGQKNRP